MDRFEREVLDWLTDGGGAHALASVSKHLRSAPWNNNAIQWMNEVDELILVSLAVQKKIIKRYADLQGFLYPDGRMQSAHWINRNKAARLEPEFISIPPSIGRIHGHDMRWHPVAEGPPPTTEDLLTLVEKALSFVKADDHDGAEEWANQVTRRGFYTVKALFFKTIFGVQDQIDARNHAEACWRLDATPGGLKARDLLMGLLDDNQIDTLIKYGYFDVIKVNPLGLHNLPQSQRRYFKRIVGRDRRYMIFSRRFRIYPAWPNGNVILMNDVGQGLAHFCLHPPEAYPDDDIAVAQKLLIESDELQFWNDANVTQHPADWTTEEIAQNRYRDRNEFLRTLDRRRVPTKEDRTSAAAESRETALVT